MSKAAVPAEMPAGLETAHRKPAAEGLAKLLADTYLLALKTHAFHWNVTGPLFPMLHALFEQQYTELAVAADTIAERIRALGHPAPGSSVQFARLASVKEETGTPPAEAMIRQLLEDQETLVRTARQGLAVAEHDADEPTVDLLIERIQAHEKTAWMLRALLE